MELRVLQYFLAVTREQSISGAAEALHLSQPTLSRQLKDMEEELGKQLLIRGNRRITLTEEGMILRKRAEEIMELVRKAEHEIALSDEFIAADITIGAGETDGVRFLARAAKALQKDYPDIHLHIISGDRETVQESLDRGLTDFGLVFGSIDTSKYEYLKVPAVDHFGVLMRKDAPLAPKEVITTEDLEGLPLIVSRQMLEDSFTYPSSNLKDLNVVGTYNLLFNGSLMVEEGMGYAICFDKIINVTGDSPLCFRPLHADSDIKAEMAIVWKKYQSFTKAAEKFLLKMQELANVPTPK